VEAVIITTFKEFEDQAKAIKVGYDLHTPSYETARYLPGVFTAALNDLGKEWVTGPTLARFVGVS